MSGAVETRVSAQLGTNVKRKTSVNEDPRLVQKTREPAFFFLEPGAGVIAVGLLLEPDKYKQLIAWFVSLTAGTALCSQRSVLARILSVASVSYALIPFGSGGYLRFMFGMATVMRAMRVIEVLLNPHYFQSKGTVYTIKFCYLYHDIRKASLLETLDEKRQAIQQVKRDLLFNGLGLITTTALLKIPRIASNKATLAALSMMRSCFFVITVEASYRIHLCLLGVKPPVCFDEPWKAQTVAEFWGQRWNLAIAGQLRNLFFKPLAEAGFRKAGEFCVFLASAALHMIPIVWLGGSKRSAMSTAAFFAVQPALIAIESRFKLKSQIWAQLALWATAPLFSLPMYKVTS